MLADKVSYFILIHHRFFICVLTTLIFSGNNYFCHLSLAFSKRFCLFSENLFLGHDYSCLLFNFFVNGVLAKYRVVLFKFKPFRCCTSVFCGYISRAARLFGTFKNNLYTISFCHWSIPLLVTFLFSLHPSVQQ